MNLLDEQYREFVQPTTLTKKLTLNGETKAYPIYRVRLELLYYNDQNDRIATWISQYKSEQGGFHNLSKEAYNAVIEDFIIKSNPASIEKTKNNIKAVNQREPGVILSDGRIVEETDGLLVCENLLKKILIFAGLKRSFSISA